MFAVKLFNPNWRCICPSLRSGTLKLTKVWGACRKKIYVNGRQGLDFPSICQPLFQCRKIYPSGLLGAKVHFLWSSIDSRLFRPRQRRRPVHMFFLPDRISPPETKNLSSKKATAAVISKARSAPGGASILSATWWKPTVARWGLIKPLMATIFISSCPSSAIRDFPRAAVRRTSPPNKEFS